MSEETVEEPVDQARVVVELGTEAQPLLIRFSIGPPPTGTSSFDSYALRTDAGWTFVDPVQPTRSAAQRLARLIRERPVATVLTSAGHERFCYAVREGEWRKRESSRAPSVTVGRGKQWPTRPRDSEDLHGEHFR